MKERHLYLAIIILAGMAFWPVAEWYIKRTTDGSDDPWGLLALGVGLAFIWINRSMFTITNRSLILSGTFLVIFAVGFNHLPPLIRAAVAILAIGSITSSLWRIPSISGLLMLSLPIVASLQFYLGYPLRLLAAVITEGILRVAHLPISRSGTNLLLANQTIGVDPACSGIEMLWVGLLFTFIAGAYYRWNIYRTILATLISIFAIAIANSLRVTLLFFKESGMVNLPEWTHEGIGIAVFLFILLLYQKWMGNNQTNHPVTSKGQPASNRSLLSFAMLLLLAIILPKLPQQNNQLTTTHEFPGWPETYRGNYLEPVQPSKEELSFAQTFPGRIGVFTAGNQQIILRWIDRPTRKLHSSSVCLRASGYQIERERAGHFLAFSTDGEQGWAVEEEIYSQLNETERHSEVSSWFWSATLGNTTGPWWAVTRIQPLGF